MTKKTLPQTIADMLVENTGINCMDSGGDNNRRWQRNQGKTLKDYVEEPEATVDAEGVTSSDELYPTTSVFHVLTKYAGIELDDLCHEFNAQDVPDFDSDVYGVSEQGLKWLTANSFKIKESFNTYNGESSLSQVVQGTYATRDEDLLQEYVLLQIHGGADIRGGYTDAKLFKLTDDYVNLVPRLYGSIDGVQVDTCYDGISLLDEDGKPVPVKLESEIDIDIMEM